MNSVYRPASSFSSYMASQLISHFASYPIQCSIMKSILASYLRELIIKKFVPYSTSWPISPSISRIVSELTGPSISINTRQSRHFFVSHIPSKHMNAFIARYPTQPTNLSIWSPIIGLVNSYVSCLDNQSMSIVSYHKDSTHTVLTYRSLLLTPYYHFIHTSLRW